MITAILIVYGLCLGSFVNALVWRIHEQARIANRKKKTKSVKADSRQLTPNNRLSISRGRSMCPDCKHELAAKDLIPVLSWITLGGKCRYCKKPISAQYPLVELITAILFVASYIWWPRQITGFEVGSFITWLTLLVGFMALIVYDLRWLLLPNRLVYPLTAIAGIQAIFTIFSADNHLHALLGVFAAVAIGGGLFYVLFQVSEGKWIGGGDVKLGWLLGLSVATAANSALFIFLAALLGSLVSVPLLLMGKVKKGTVIPFGPFLIVGAIIAQLFGSVLIAWYQHHLLGI